MGLKELFKKNKSKYITVVEPSDIIKTEKEEDTKPSVPDGMWVKCPDCNEIIYSKDFDKGFKVCPKCKHHFRLSAKERIAQIIDEGTYEEFDKELISINPLEFKNYEEKLEDVKDKTGLNEAVITGQGKINGEDAVVCVMDSSFIMGSMGSVVGEKITRAIENATAKRLPVIIFCASGGARMQEGIYSLMQMAKTSAALGRHADAGLLYISVITDPTTGGVTASFAMLGDIIIAEPKALIGFAGRRVIEGTIKQKLPDEFQTAEFLLSHGFIDKIISREKMKNTLYKLLSLHPQESEENVQKAGLKSYERS